MPRKYTVVVYDNDTEVWWKTIGTMSFIHCIRYHTGDTVYFNFDGTVMNVFSSCGWTDAV